MRNRLPHLRDRQAVDRAPEKKRGVENFDGAKLTRPPIFHGEFTANAVDLARQRFRELCREPTPSINRTMIAVVPVRRATRLICGNYHPSP
jgi:hypothetical protein